jgi:hypothetical protein
MSQVLGTTLSVEERLVRMEAIHEIQEINFRYTEGTDFGRCTTRRTRASRSATTVSAPLEGSTPGVPARCQGQTILVSRTA